MTRQNESSKQASSSVSAIGTSQAAVVHPILGCINVAEMSGDQSCSLGSGIQWDGSTAAHNRFLREFFPHRSETERLTEAELRNIASRDVRALNAFLEQQGFGHVQLTSPLGVGSLGMASVLKVGVRWKSPGETTRIHSDHGEFPAARLVGGVEIRTVEGHDQPVAVVLGEGHRVFITRLDEPLEGLDLLGKAQELASSRHRVCWDFEGVIFPTVDFDDTSNIDWLVGLTATNSEGERAVVSEAVQATRFKMNHLGARVESAVAVVMTKGIPKDPLKIDGPFLVALWRYGMALPIIAIRCCPDSWKDPGDL